MMVSILKKILNEIFQSNKFLTIEKIISIVKRRYKYELDINKIQLVFESDVQKTFFARSKDGIYFFIINDSLGEVVIAHKTEKRIIISSIDVLVKTYKIKFFSIKDCVLVSKKFFDDVSDLRKKINSI